MNHPVHGQEGWILVEYSWDEDTGNAYYLYERTVEGILQTERVEKPQTLYWVHPSLREPFFDAPLA